MSILELDNHKKATIVYATSIYLQHYIQTLLDGLNVDPKRNVSIILTPGKENHALTYKQWHVHAVTTTKLPQLES